MWSEAAELLQQEPGSLGPGAREGLACWETGWEAIAEAQVRAGCGLDLGSGGGGGEKWIGQGE